MRRLGLELRTIREQRGLDLRQAATLLKMSPSAISRMENAQVVTRLRDVNYLLITYGVTDPTVRDPLFGLAGAGPSKDWIKRHGKLIEGRSEFVMLEQDSSAIRVWQPLVVPGLLQTPEYAAAVMAPVYGRVPADLARSVAFRMARKELFERSPNVKVEAIMGEAAIRQCLGGPAALKSQLEYLLEAETRPNTTLRILPFAAHSSPGLDGAFTMLDVEKGDFTVVVVDTLESSVFLEREEEIKPYELVYASVRDLALPPSESRTLIEKTLKGL